MSNPLVSVIIPAYNADKFIVEALDSAFAQTYRPIEIIVVDDGSTDRTAEIVRKYVRDVRNVRTNEVIEQVKQSNNSNIFREQSDRTTRTFTSSKAIELIYIYQQNSGPSKARNTAIKTAKGDYIAFLDADDLWTPLKLEGQMNYITSNKDCSLVFGDMTVFSTKGTIIDSAFKKNGYPQCDEKGKVLNAFEALLQRNYISSGTVLLKKDCFNESGYFDASISHAEDYDLWLRICLIFNIACIPEIFRLKRIHDTNLSKNEEHFLKSCIYIFKKISENFSVNLKSRGINIEHYMLKTIKKLSYFYYLKKEYTSALKTFLQYVFYRIKLQLLP